MFGGGGLWIDVLLMYKVFVYLFEMWIMVFFVMFFDIDDGFFGGLEVEGVFVFEVDFNSGFMLVV